MSKCRICLQLKDEAGSEKFIQPCNCKGSHKNVHFSCLSKRIETSRSSKCSKCNQQYTGVRIEGKALGYMAFLKHSVVLPTSAFQRLMIFQLIVPALLLNVDLYEKLAYYKEAHLYTFEFFSMVLMNAVTGRAMLIFPAMYKTWSARNSRMKVILLNAIKNRKQTAITRTKCRICLQGIKRTESDPFVQPCHCKGTQASVHFNCLTEWIESSQSDQCSICTAQYTGVRVERKAPGLVAFLKYRGNIEVSFSIGTMLLVLVSVLIICGNLLRPHVAIVWIVHATNWTVGILVEIRYYVWTRTHFKLHTYLVDTSNGNVV